MKFRVFGDKSLPTIIMLHGGGLSWWSLENIIYNIKEKYHIVAPIIDGHGEDGDTEFVSIEDSALKLINYVDEKFNGKVYAISGFSIGAQIVTEILCRRSDIAEYAIVESALLYPMRFTKNAIQPLYKLCYRLIKNKWFSKLQAKVLCLKPEIFEKYYNDALKITKNSMINMSISNTNYKLKESIRNTKAKLLVIVGAKEMKIMKKSAKRLNFLVPNSRLYMASGLNHGELSLNYPETYIYVINDFLTEEKIRTASI